MHDHLITLAGPVKTRTGGMILFTGNEDQAWQMIKQDPFYNHDLADYQIIKWLCYDQSRFN